MRLAVLFRRLGPYHQVRLEAAGRLGDLWCVEGGRLDKTYAWDFVGQESRFHRLTLFPKADLTQVPCGEIRRAVITVLDHIDPAAVAIPGWENALSLGALQWAMKRVKPIVLMSDSNHFDAPRNPLKEWFKRRVVSLCAAGLVAGTTASNYLVKLGMNQDRVFTGYDVVDNKYFAAGAAESRDRRAGVRKQYGLPRGYFLASARFVGKKNLPRLIEAYWRYRNKCTIQEPRREAWDLVILGDGPQRGEIETYVADLRIGQWVHLPGFKQYNELPAYYGLASAFVHASTVEQWGLVVNEAMAAGLPVLVSNRCGCAPDLVQEGVNGFTFDPLNEEQLACLMLRLTEAPESEIVEMGAVGQQMIKNWSPKTFARNLWEAGSTALVEAQRHVTIWDKLVLRVVSNIGVSPANNGAKC